MIQVPRMPDASARGRSTQSASCTKGSWRVSSTAMTLTDSETQSQIRLVSVSAVSKPLPDVVGPDLTVLLAGINPSIMSFERGHHFARPGNRFWRALHESGWTPRLMKPAEDGELPAVGIGITNVVDRPTRAAAELSDSELREGAG